MATPIPENRAGFELGEIADATGGALVDLPRTAAVAGVSTDSRTVARGGLFVALAGETHDGHRFVPAARERGATVLVARGAGIEGPRVEVDAPLAALGALARAFVGRERRERPLPALAIGGAAGKTTTKTLAAAAVEALCGPTLVTHGNLNNRIGVPMTLFTLEPGHRAAVLECGTSEPGEIAALAAIVRPEVALVTNVDVEHSEKLGTLDEIADEEGALLSGAARFAIANADDPRLLSRLARARAQRLTFGTSSAADLWLAERSTDADGASTVAFRLGKRLLAVLGAGGDGIAGARGGGGEMAAAAGGAGGGQGLELRFSTRLLGEAAAVNLAAALLGALALLGRWPAPGDWDRLRRAIAAVDAVPGRLAPRWLGSCGIFVLDDTYNSNPRSVDAALEAAREVADRRQARLVVALGDMLELGGLAAAAHVAMLRHADAAGAAQMLLVGAETARALEALAGSLHTPHRVFSSSAEAAPQVGHAVHAGDVLLVKGSRGMRMERLIEALELPRRTET